LLARDVKRITEHFARQGAVRDGEEFARDLWTAWSFADLIPEELRSGIEVEPDVV
jgi:hypothetical protein